MGPPRTRDDDGKWSSKVKVSPSVGQIFQLVYIECEGPSRGACRDLFHLLLVHDYFPCLTTCSSQQEGKLSSIGFFRLFVTMSGGGGDGQSERHRRERILKNIREYYDLEATATKGGAPGEANEGAASTARPPAAASSSSVSDQNYDLDSKNFSASKYITKLLRDKPLDKIIEADNAMRDSVRVLDKQLQSHVFENYKEFIAATETIRDVHVHVDDMNGTLSTLAENVNHMEKVSAQLDEGLASHRTKIRQVLEANEILRSIQVLVQLPDSLHQAIDRRRYAEAAKLWATGDKVFAKHDTIASFAKTRQECRVMAERLHDELVKYLQTASLDLTQPETLEKAKVCVRALQLLQGTSIDKNKCWAETRAAAATVDPSGALLLLPSSGGGGASGSSSAEDTNTNGAAGGPPAADHDVIFFNDAVQLLLTEPLQRFTEATKAVGATIDVEMSRRDQLLSKRLPELLIQGSSLGVGGGASSAVGGAAAGAAHPSGSGAFDAAAFVVQSTEALSGLTLVPITDAVRVGATGVRVALERVAEVSREAMAPADATERRLMDLAANVAAAVTQVQQVMLSVGAAATTIGAVPFPPTGPTAAASSSLSSEAPSGAQVTSASAGAASGGAPVASSAAVGGRPMLLPPSLDELNTLLPDATVYCRVVHLLAALRLAAGIAPQPSAAASGGVSTAAAAITGASTITALQSLLGATLATKVCHAIVRVKQPTEGANPLPPPSSSTTATAAAAGGGTGGDPTVPTSANSFSSLASYVLQKFVRQSDAEMLDSFCNKVQQQLHTRVVLTRRLARLEVETHRVAVTVTPFLESTFESTGSRVVKWCLSAIAHTAALLPTLTQRVVGNANAEGSAAPPLVPPTAAVVCESLIRALTDAIVKAIYECSKAFEMLLADFVAPPLSASSSSLASSERKVGGSGSAGGTSSSAVAAQLSQRIKELPLRCFADILAVLEKTSRSSGDHLSSMWPLLFAASSSSQPPSSQGFTAVTAPMPPYVAALGLAAIVRCLKRVGLKSLEQRGLITRDTSVLRGSLDNAVKILTHFYIRHASWDLSSIMRREQAALLAAFPLAADQRRSTATPPAAAQEGGGGVADPNNPTTTPPPPSGAVVVITGASRLAEELFRKAWVSFVLMVAALVPRDATNDVDDGGGQAARVQRPGSSTGGTSAISRSRGAGSNTGGSSSMVSATGTFALVAPLSRSDRSSTGGAGGTHAMMDRLGIGRGRNAQQLSLRPSIVDASHVVECVTSFVLRDWAEETRAAVFSRLAFQQLQVDSSVFLVLLAELLHRQLSVPTNAAPLAVSGGVPAAPGGVVGSRGGAGPAALLLKREDRILPLILEVVACAYERAQERSPLAPSAVEAIAKQSLDVGGRCFPANV